MKFLTSKHFERHELWNGVLYLAGTCNYTPVQLAKLFSDHEIPQTRGNSQLCGRAMITVVSQPDLPTLILVVQRGR